MIGMDVDVAVRAHETHQEPVLALAAIFAAPHLADQMIGQFVEIFFAAARDDFYQSAMDAGFLTEFADRRFLGLLAVVDPALRHMPRLARGIEPLADEDAAVEVMPEWTTSEHQYLMRTYYAVFSI